MSDKSDLAELVEAFFIDADGKMREIGTFIGKLYTDRGFPPDMALDELTNLSKPQKLAVLFGCCSWLVQHKRNSQATEKAIERQRKQNREALHRFVATGEAGLY